MNCFVLSCSRRSWWRGFQGTDLSVVEEFVGGGKRCSWEIRGEVELEVVVVAKTVVVVVVGIGVSVKRMRGLREERGNASWAGGGTEEEVVGEALR